MMGWMLSELVHPNCDRLILTESEGDPQNFDRILELKKYWVQGYSKQFN